MILLKALPILFRVLIFYKLEPVWLHVMVDHVVMQTALLSFHSSVFISVEGTMAPAQRIDSPAHEQFSAATTTTSQEEEFEDAVDELPKDEFKPAHPDSEY